MKFYYGNAGENFLLSSLSRRGYDAFKLPVDYGFDIMAMNHRQVGSENPKIYFFQVKTRTLRTEDRYDTQSGRKAYDFTIRLSGYTLTLMENSPNRAVIVYVYSEEGRSRELERADSPSFCFWLSGKDLVALQDFVIPDSSGAGTALQEQEKSGGYFTITFQVVWQEEGNDSQHLYLALCRKTASSSEGETRYLDRNASCDDAPETGSHFRLSAFLDQAASMS